MAKKRKPRKRKPGFVVADDGCWTLPPKPKRSKRKRKA